MNPAEILSHFSLPTTARQAIPFGSGHINQTFRVLNTDPNGQEYLLQKINHHVFRDVAGMMENIRLVTDYLQVEKPIPKGQKTLTLIPTISGESYCQDAEGGYWRVYVFLKELVSYDRVTSHDQIYEGAKSFGIFLASLTDFPVGKLVDTIPDFHNVRFRLANLRRAVKTDQLGRMQEIKVWLNFVEAVSPKMTQIEDAGAKGLIPLRVTHNDTKFNNVLLDKEGKGVCVIDLDTVMPGYVQYDFGDGVRTTISTAAEDEADLSQIQIDKERFEAFASGYLEATKAILSDKETRLLPLSGALFAYLMGVRFLTDYLMGDVYYKIHFEKQNLQRAMAQLELCRKILKRLPELEKIIYG